MMAMLLVLLGCWASCAAGALPPPPPPPSVTVGDIRVQALSADVVRVERRGPRGFEDSPTFLVQPALGHRVILLIPGRR